MKKEKQFLIGSEYTFSEIVEFFCGAEFETCPTGLFYESDGVIVEEFEAYGGQSAINVTYKNIIPEQSSVWFVYHDLNNGGGIYKCVYNNLIY